jgi:hypothetical protein
MAHALPILILAALSGAGCVRAAEGMVRERAATDFACADYALHVEEVSPDVYRAAGCGRELIYACLPQRTARPKSPAQSPDDFADTASPQGMECHPKVP